MKFGDRLSSTAISTLLLLASLQGVTTVAQAEPSKRPKLDCTSVSDISAFGHFSYPEIPRQFLVRVGRGVSLSPPAAQSFQAMQRAAAIEGVSLVPLSGFRDRQTQRSLFFDGAAERGQSLEQRARVSAPPGFSEHHTGYAIDIGDANAPGSHLQVSFQDTAAGRWLLANAGEFGFELSFPPSHPCVNYEPWHWRWVGDEYSQTLFRAARELIGIQGNR